MNWKTLIPFIPYSLPYDMISLHHPQRPSCLPIILHHITSHPNEILTHLGHLKIQRKLNSYSSAHQKRTTDANSWEGNRSNSSKSRCTELHVGVVWFSMVWYGYRYGGGRIDKLLFYFIFSGIQQSATGTYHTYHLPVLVLLFQHQNARWNW